VVRSITVRTYLYPGECLWTKYEHVRSILVEIVIDCVLSLYADRNKNRLIGICNHVKLCIVSAAWTWHVILTQRKGGGVSTRAWIINQVAWQGIETSDGGRHLCCIETVYAYGQTCFSVELQLVNDRGRFEGPLAAFLFHWEKANEYMIYSMKLFRRLLYTSVLNAMIICRNKGEDTPRKLATAISENCYQPELNTR
jgi:hypothetical protein